MARNKEEKSEIKTRVKLPLTIKLKYPFQYGQDSGLMITDITINRRFQMGDFRDMTERELQQTDAAVTLISKISGEPEPKIWMIDPVDFEVITKEIEPFFPKSQRIGARE